MGFDHSPGVIRRGAFGALVAVAVSLPGAAQAVAAPSPQTRPGAVQPATAVQPAASVLDLPDRAGVMREFADLPTWPARAVRHTLRAAAGRAPVADGWPGDTLDHLTVDLVVVTGTGAGNPATGTDAPLGLALRIEIVDCPYGQACRAPEPVAQVRDEAAALAAVEVVVDDDGYRLRGRIPRELLDLHDTSSGAAPQLPDGLSLDVAVPALAPLPATDARSSGAQLVRDVAGTRLTWSGATVSAAQPRGGTIGVGNLTVSVEVSQNHTWADQVTRAGRLKPLRGSAAAAALDTALGEGSATVDLTARVAADGALRDTSGTLLPGNRHEADVTAWARFTSGQWQGSGNIAAGVPLRHLSCPVAGECRDVESWATTAADSSATHTPGTVSVDVLTAYRSFLVPVRVSMRPTLVSPTLSASVTAPGADGRSSWSVSLRLLAGGARVRGVIAGRKAVLEGSPSLRVIRTLDTWVAPAPG